jgi:predicted RecA/RadA family phage recombinase
MTNYKQPGDIMEYSNSSTAISSGDPVVIGNRLGVAITDIAATTGVGSVQMVGVFQLDKDADESFTQGDALFYDASDSTLTKTATGNTWAGYAFEGAETSATSCRVKLEPSPKQMPVQDASVAADTAAMVVDFNLLLGKLKAAGYMANS